MLIVRRLSFVMSNFCVNSKNLFKFIMMQKTCDIKINKNEELCDKFEKDRRTFSIELRIKSREGKDCT